jgi:DNA (cytosine-5)-methyltransferase 1
VGGVKIGSLFSGYEGLGMAVQSVLGGDIAWVSDIDPGACKILAHRYPDVPNIGDIERIGLPYSDEEWKEIKAAQKFHGAEYEMPVPDWSDVEPVDVLTGGFPCQDLSAAGKREGLRPGTRSGLWGRFLDAIEQLSPPLVVIENVRGLLSANAHHPAHSDLEPCPWCVGDGSGVPLRALGAVLGDLADIGYDASWQGLRAADVGAPHGRFRVFVTAWPAAGNADVRGRHGRTAAGQQGEAGSAAGHRGSAADADGLGHERGWRTRIGRPGSADGGVFTAHPSRNGRHEGWTEPARLVGGPNAAVGGAPVAHADGSGLEGGGASGLGTERPEPLRPADAAAHADRDALREQPVTLAGRSGTTVAGLPGAETPADADGWGCEVGSKLYGATEQDPADGDPRWGHADGHPGSADWGQYAPAIRRWERLTRPAPAPTSPGKNGQPRLSAHFVEWLMGLPAGWVTDVPGLTRNEQLKALGNGVVPQQAAQALRMLLADATAPPVSVETEGAA